MTFNDLFIAEPILKAITEKGYQNPSPIQEQAIPAALLKKDLLGIAQTGTGKTAAFSIPIIQHLLENPAPTDKPRQIRALILTPTRELALQVSESITDYAKYTDLRHCTVFGGVKQREQTERLRKGVDILVATPGRLHDLMGQGFIKLNSISHFVLDEADRMLDMGFIADIRRLVPKLPKERQTLFFSATMPDPIVSLSRSMLREPVRIEIAPENPMVESIDQELYFVDRQDKRKLLIELLEANKGKSVLVFARTKHGADKIADSLSKKGIRTESIHGDKTQGARQLALSNFKSGKTKVMIATDIAARGIDIDQLDMVINYDLPDVAETYVHRIGRTGRAGHSGKAIAFCMEDEHMMVNEIQKMAGKTIPATLYGY